MLNLSCVGEHCSTMCRTTSVIVTKQLVLLSGGKVLFADKNVELKTENILIVGGGILQVNTDQVLLIIPPIYFRTLAN